MSVAKVGKSSTNKGRTASEETLLKQSKSFKKVWENPEYRQHMSDVHKGQTAWNKGLPGLSGLSSPNAKIYDNIQLLSPSGVLYTRIECLSAFSREHNVNSTNLGRVVSGKRNSYKGWTLVNQ